MVLFKVEYMLHLASKIYTATCLCRCISKMEPIFVDHPYFFAILSDPFVKSLSDHARVNGLVLQNIQVHCKNKKKRTKILQYYKMASL